MLAERHQQIMPSGSKENKRISIKKMAKTLAVSRGKVYRGISMLSGTAIIKKRQGFPTMD